jgi:hypothetical protein
MALSFGDVTFVRDEGATLIWRAKDPENPEGFYEVHVEKGLCSKTLLEIPASVSLLHGSRPDDTPWSWGYFLPEFIPVLLKILERSESYLQEGMGTSRPTPFEGEAVEECDPFDTPHWDASPDELPLHMSIQEGVWGLALLGSYTVHHEQGMVVLRRPMDFEWREEEYKGAWQAHERGLIGGYRVTDAELMFRERCQGHVEEERVTELILDYATETHNTTEERAHAEALS